MPAIIDHLNRLSTVWLGLMGAILWQSTLVVLLVTIVALLLRRASPRVRYWLWQIVAIKLLLMPFWVLAVPWPFAALRSVPPVESALPLPRVSPPPIGVSPRPSLPIAPQPAEPSPPPSAPSLLALVGWPTWLFLAWAGVVTWRILSIARQRYGLARLMRLTVPAPGDLAERVDGLARRLGLRRQPSVVLVDHPGLLFVCGLWGPRLVLPRSLPESLRPADMERVILHELAHLRRGDLYWGWTIELARIIYFFHPLVYWVAYCLHLERELACDQVAMAVTGHTPGDYAQTLVRVAGHGSEPATGGMPSRCGATGRHGDAAEHADPPLRGVTACQPTRPDDNS
jgi:beta-lactamase regulating signal transducer with metallopeptidase domain